MEREKVLQILRQVVDPETSRNIIDLKFVQFLVANKKRIRFILELPEKYEYIEKIREKCLHVLKDCANDVEIRAVTRNSPIESKKPHIIAGIDKIIPIMSGKGGVGKSTVAVHLALQLARNLRVGLLDADIFGPSVAQLMDCLEYPELNQDEKIVPMMRHNLKFVSMGSLLTQEKATVWRGPMASKAIRKMFEAVEWGELDLLLVDMPPGTSDIHLTVIENYVLFRVILISTAHQIALADVIKAYDMLQLMNVEIAGIVSNMSYFMDEAQNKNYPFGYEALHNIAKRLNLPILAEIPLMSKLGEIINEQVLRDKEIGQIFHNIIKLIL